MTVVEALIELQNVDGRVRELEAELKDLPRRKAKERTRLTGVNAELLAAKDGMASVDRTAKGYEADAEAIKERISELKSTQAGLKSNREYQQYSEQIDLMGRNLDVAENNQLAALDNAPSAKARYDEAQARFDAAKSGVEALCAEIDERIMSVKAELETLRSERGEKVAQVSDKKALLYYERLRTKRWPVVVPLTHQGVCDGCHLVQPPSVSQLVDANERIANGEVAGDRKPVLVCCTMCGRILYRG